MKINELERKLIAAARAQAPSEAVPYAFEKRVMGRLSSAPVFDPLADWSSALWRAAAPCVAVALVLGVWSAFRPEAAPASNDFAQQLDSVLLGGITQDGNNTW